MLYFFRGAQRARAHEPRAQKDEEREEERRASTGTIMSDRIQLALQKRLNACLKKPENVVCAECPSRLPRWASMNLGVFICTNCSGIHRSLGVHISRVRSTQLDKWTEAQVDFMERMGNERANGFWEKNLPPNVKPTKSDLRTVEKYIRQKYEKRMYCDKETDGPVPLSAEAAGGGGDVVAAAPPQQQLQQPQPQQSAAAGLLDLFGDMPTAPAQQPAVANTSNQSPGGNWMDFGSAPASTIAVPVEGAKIATNDDDWGDFSSAAPTSAPFTTTTTTTSTTPAKGGVDILADFHVAQPQSTTTTTTTAKVETTATPPKIVASKEDIMGLFDATPPMMQQPQQSQQLQQNMMPSQQQQQMPPMGGGMMMNGGAPQMMQQQQNVMGGGMPQMPQMGGFMGGGMPQQQYQQPQMIQGEYMQQQTPPSMQNMYGGMPPQTASQMMYNQQPQMQMPQMQQLNPNAPPISLDTFGMPSTTTTTARSEPSPKKEELFPDLKW